MRIVLVAVACVVFAGCTFGAKTCTASSDCGGDECVSGFCVAPSDSGMGGGSGGGTGGGGTGGGGGGTGGGGAGGGGGGVDRCAGVVCPVGYLCSSANGDCLLHVTSLKVLSPDGGVTNDAGVVLHARLSADASVSLPTSLEYQVDNGALQTLMQSTVGEYEKVVSLADGPHTIQVLAAFADAGFSDSATVNVDTRGPDLSATLPSVVQQRDEIFTLQLVSTEPVQMASVDVRLNGTRLVAASGACATNAGCWTVDLSLPTLDALTGNFTLTATAADLVGNSKASTLGMVSVTRKRWEVVVTGSEEIRGAPAVGIDGTLFLGSRATDQAGSLWAINVDGGVKTSITALGAVLSLATETSIDAGLVYYTSNDSSGGQLGARLASDLTRPPGVLVATTGNTNSPTYSALALVAKSPSEVGAIAAFNAASLASRVVIYGSASAPDAVPGVSGSTFDFAPVPASVPVASNIVVRGSEAYFLTALAGSGLNWHPVTGLNATLAAGTAVALETGGNDCCLVGQAVLGNGSLIGGTTVGARKLYTAPPAMSGTLGVVVDNGVPAVASSSVAFVGRGNDLFRFNPSSLSGAGVALKSGVGVIRTSPVLAKARVGQTSGLGYAVTSLGNLVVFAQDGSADSALDWGSVFTSSSTVYAHPTLDCNRRAGAATSTTGILYVVNSGRVSAIVVDSPSLLDTAGAWPKYQRTAGNAGNTDARFALNPGCP